MSFSALCESVIAGWEGVSIMLAQREIAEFVDDEKCRIRIGAQFTDEGVIHLGSQQVIEHVHRSRKEHSHIGLARAPADHFRPECLAHSWISNQHQIGAFTEKLQIEQTWL